MFRVLIIFAYTLLLSLGFKIKKREEKNALLHSSFFFSSARCGHRVSCTLGIREREREVCVAHSEFSFCARTFQKRAHKKEHNHKGEREIFFYQRDKTVTVISLSLSLL